MNIRGKCLCCVIRSLFLLSFLHKRFATHLQIQVYTYYLPNDLCKAVFVTGRNRGEVGGGRQPGRGASLIISIFEYRGAFDIQFTQHFQASKVYGHITPKRFFAECQPGWRGALACTCFPEEPTPPSSLHATQDLVCAL